VYWPAFLMALDLPLPRRVLAHGHWTINHEKMSKSTGNVVNPFFAIDRFGVDPMRFYLARMGNVAEDSNYDNAYIIACYKKLLQSGIGNITSRTIGCAKGNLRSFIVNAASNQLPPATPRDVEYQAFIEKVPMEVAEHMKDLDMQAAVRSITVMIEQANKYFHEREPWNKSPESQRVIYNVSETLRISAILLQPFMPTKAPELLDILEVDREPAKRRFSAAAYGSDPDYGDGVQKRILFPPLIVEE
jgi:methionyl-tRNA synthetase